VPQNEVQGYKWDTSKKSGEESNPVVKVIWMLHLLKLTVASSIKNIEDMQQTVVRKSGEVN
jgi:hypothetical protein